MNQFFTRSSTATERRTHTRQALVGLVAVGALFLGSTGVGTAATAARTVTITATDNGRVIVATQGAHIVITLTNPEWTFTTMGTRKVVELVSTSVTPVKTSGAIQACVPGRTCGSIKAVYYALEPGVMRIIARLTSCPTGTVCTASESHFTVVIRVR
jgi:hypothetical protein